MTETADHANTPLLSGQPVNSVLQFNLTVLLDFLKEHQDGRAPLQITCPYQGVPLPYVDINLGSSLGIDGKLEFSYELSVAFIKYVNLRGNGREAGTEM
jgi:hypothetical protein